MLMADSTIAAPELLTLALLFKAAATIAATEPRCLLSSQFPQAGMRREDLFLAFPRPLSRRRQNEAV